MLILWWKVRLPGIEILLAKRDVDSAYKIVWIRVNDVGFFATELPGEYLGLLYSVLLLFLVLTFGWGGSPGNYMAYAIAAVQVFESSDSIDPILARLISGTRLTVPSRAGEFGGQSP